RVLQHCARLLPTEDGVLAARLGGEEFVLIVPGLDEESSLLYAGRVCEVFLNHPSPEGIALTVSIGVSTTQTPIAALDFVQQASSALYEAKRAGRNRSSHYRTLERKALNAGE